MKKTHKIREKVSIKDVEKVRTIKGRAGGVTGSGGRGIIWDCPVYKTESQRRTQTMGIEKLKGIKKDR